MLLKKAEFVWLTSYWKRIYNRLNGIILLYNSILFQLLTKIRVELLNENCCVIVIQYQVY